MVYLCADLMVNMVMEVRLLFHVSSVLWEIWAKWKDVAGSFVVSR